MPDPKTRLAVALDYPDAHQAMKLVDTLGQTCQWFKVGMELYYAAGNDIIRQLRDRGFDVFLDLKLHDIPNTVAGAVRSVTQTGAALLTIHAGGGAAPPAPKPGPPPLAPPAGGGAAMMTAAAEAARAPGSPRLLAVTVLTSMDTGQLTGTGITASPADQVLRLAKLARQSGIDGFVCSAEEVASVRAATGPDTLLVIPGIRPAGAAIGDQKRIATPAQAIAAGASLLVVGRPITQAPNPAAAAQAILNEIAQAQSR